MRRTLEIDPGRVEKYRRAAQSANAAATEARDAYTEARSRLRELQSNRREYQARGAGGDLLARTDTEIEEAGRECEAATAARDDAAKSWGYAADIWNAVSGYAAKAGDANVRRIVERGT